MSRTKKFIKNTITTALLNIITMISGFILPKIMLSVYGSEVNGLVTSITQLIAYLTLVEAGLSGATVYSLYKPLADNDEYGINRVLAAAKNFYYRTGYLFLGLIVGIAFIYPLFIKTNLLTYKEIVLLFIILGVNGVLEFFTLAKYRALLTADQKTYIISLASIVQVLINLVIIFTLSYCGVSIVTVRFIAILAIFIRTFLLWGYCKKKYLYLDFTVEPNNFSMEKRWDALYMQVIGIVHTGAPILIATIFLTLNDVSIYSIYYTVINGVNSLLSIFSSGLAATFGDIIARGEKEKFKQIFTQFEYIYYIILTIVYSIMSVSYIPFIRIYTEGADINYLFPTLAFLMTLNGYFYNLKTPFGMLTISTGKYKESRIQITLQALIQIGCGVIFAKIWGVNGIVIAALFSNIYRDIDFIFFAPKHLTNYTFKSSLFMWIRSFCIILFNIIILSIIPTMFITGYISWMIYTIIIGVISTILTISINAIFDRYLFKEVMIRFKLIKN